MMPDTESSFGGERIWSVQSLRLTAFPNPTAILDADSWWDGVAGEPPESDTRRVREGIIQKQGPHAGGQLTLVVQPSLIHWRLDPAENPALGSVHVPMIGGLPATLDAFLQCMSLWFALPSCPSVHRLAFGAVLVNDVSSRKEGYEFLSHYLRTLQLDAEGSSDLLYQINRPRPSLQSISGLRVNRLSRWLVAVYTFSMIQLLPPVSAGAASPITTQAAFAAQVELDINSDAEYKGNIPGAQMQALYRELAELGLELAANGDIA